MHALLQHVLGGETTSSLRVPRICSTRFSRGSSSKPTIKGCVDRIFGSVAGLRNSTTESHSSPGGSAPGYAASTTHSIWALGAWAFRQAQQLLQLPLQLLLSAQAGT